MNLDLLRELSEAMGPPGGEGPVREILRAHLHDRVDELRTDVLGNLFAVKRASRTSPPSPPLAGEGSQLPPSFLGKGAAGLGPSEPTSPPAPPLAGEGRPNTPPSFLGKGAGGLGPSEPTSPPAPPLLGEGSQLPPSFLGKGAGGLGRPPRILVTAHMDEAGLMVVQINANGLLQVRAVGRMEARGLLGQAIHIGDKRIPGVIGLAPPHLTSAGQGENMPDLDDLGVDIGVDTKDAAAGVVKRGDYAVPATRFGQVGHLLKGKVLDNRVGVAVVAALLDGDYPCDVHAVFTVQEGVGGRGARVAAYAIEPDAAIIVDGVGVDELPDEEQRIPPPTLGAGPLLPFSDNSVQLDRRLAEHLRAIARREAIPYQAQALVELASDARTVQLAQIGVPTALVGLPIRYTHLPVSLAHPADLDAAERLIRHSLLSWTHNQIGV